MTVFINERSQEIVDAPCQSADPEIFFPDPTDHVRITEAKSLCDQCQPKNKDRCLEFAIANKVAYGVWGGLTEEERKRLQRRIARSNG
jgi:WhiB family transcriptional regulator, redox-sensing transcriptional regulator